MNNLKGISLRKVALCTFPKLNLNSFFQNRFFSTESKVEEFRKNAHKTIDLICDYYKNIESLPVSPNTKPGDVRKQIPQFAPNKPEKFEDILNDVNKVIIPGLTNWQSPNFFAFYPSNSSFPAILGDLLSSGFAQQGMLWATSPACTELEMSMMDWLADMLKLPENFFFKGKGGGVIQGTASEAVLSCVVAARYRIMREKLAKSGLSEEAIQAKLVMYTSDQGHSCIKKAAIIAGIPQSNFRALPTDSKNFALHAETLQKAIESDKKNGLFPFFVCTTVGTTSTCAVDEVVEIGKLCKQHNIWLHVDAAYAGSACICPEFRHYINGVEYADSFNFNPHKWLLTNFDCSALWVSNRTELIDAMNIIPEYLKNSQSDSGAVIDYRNWQIPLGRRMRALKLWLVIRSYGIQGLQDYIRKHVQAAEEIEELIKKDNRFELIVPRTLSLLCFRLKGSNEKNKQLLENVKNTGKALLSHSVIADKFFLRMAIGGSFTSREHTLNAWKLVQLEAEKILSSN